MSLEAVEPGVPDPATEFWKVVDRSAGPDACWPPVAIHEWAFFYGRRRFAWIYTHGQIQKGLHLLHDPVRCNHTWCCNPAHMRLGTHAENMKDKAIANTCDMSLRTHCDCGYRYAPGSRECQPCAQVVAECHAVIQRRQWPEAAASADGARENP